MNAPTFPSLAELRVALGEQVQSMVPGSDGHISMRASGPDVRAIIQYLRREYRVRVVTVFAEDRRADDERVLHPLTVEMEREQMDVRFAAQQKTGRAEDRRENESQDGGRQAATGLS